MPIYGVLMQIYGVLRNPYAPVFAEKHTQSDPSIAKELLSLANIPLPSVRWLKCVWATSLSDSVACPNFGPLEGTQPPSSFLHRSIHLRDWSGCIHRLVQVLQADCPMKMGNGHGSTLAVAHAFNQLSKGQFAATLAESKSNHPTPQTPSPAIWCWPPGASTPRTASRSPGDRP